jgi:hypothetical protein
MIASAAPQLQIAPPRRLTFSAVLIISSYGLLLVIPVVLAMMFVSLLHLGVLTLLIPLLAVALTTFLLPLGFGNPYVVKLVRSMEPNLAPAQPSFIAQITLTPRIRSGLRALLEDADDVGWLTVSDSGLLFQGDSILLSVPFRRIETVTAESIGWRGLFLYGPQTVITVIGLPNVSAFKLAERSSWLLTASRKNARKLQSCVAAKVRLNG